MLPYGSLTQKGQRVGVFQTSWLTWANSETYAHCRSLSGSHLLHTIQHSLNLFTAFHPQKIEGGTCPVKNLINALNRASSNSFAFRSEKKKTKPKRKQFRFVLLLNKIYTSWSFNLLSFLVRWTQRNILTTEVCLQYLKKSLNGKRSGRAFHDWL